MIDSGGEDDDFLPFERVDACFCERNDDGVSDGIVE